MFICLVWDLYHNSMLTPCFKNVDPASSVQFASHVVKIFSRSKVSPRPGGNPFYLFFIMFIHLKSMLKKFRSLSMQMREISIVLRCTKIHCPSARAKADYLGRTMSRQGR